MNVQALLRKLAMCSEMSYEKATSLVCQSFRQIMEFLAKLSFLEYAQTSPNMTILSKIFSSFGHNPSCNLFIWRCLMAEISISVFPWNILREKYPSLKKDTNDRLDHMLGIWERVQILPEAVTSNDINDLAEHLCSLLQDVGFLQEVTVAKQSADVISYQNKTLSLAPWWRYTPEEWQEIEECSWEKGFQHYFPNYWNMFLGKSLPDFTDYVMLYKKKYILPPWIEIQLQGYVQKSWDNRNIWKHNPMIVLEGFPGTGKTSLAVNLDSMLIPDYADKVYGYFLGMPGVFPSANSIIAWVQQHSIMQEKIVFVLDGLELLDKQEYWRFWTWLHNSPYQKCLWLFCQRQNELHKVPARYVIRLTPQDNIAFEETFSAEYIARLCQKYIGSLPLSKQIWSLLQKQAKPYSVRQLAQELNIFTPRVMQKLLDMQPLLEKHSSYYAGRQYTIFHPICQKF